MTAPFRWILAGLATAAALAQAPDPAARLRPLLGTPYVEDAVTDAAGRTVTFRQPDRPLSAPGLNCSGFVVEAARRLLGFRGSPAEAARDRRGDSGPGAPGGQDWDFGYDLALNLSEDQARRWLTAAGPRDAAVEAPQLEGWPVRDPEAWGRATASFDRRAVALAVFLRPGPGGRRFHHVGLVQKDGAGRAWFYQTLPKGRVHRLDLASAEGFARLCAMFGPQERVALLVVEP
jgi:hypothetical protein